MSLWQLLQLWCEGLSQSRNNDSNSEKEAVLGVQTRKATVCYQEDKLGWTKEIKSIPNLKRDLESNSSTSNLVWGKCTKIMVQECLKLLSMSKGLEKSMCSNMST